METTVGQSPIARGTETESASRRGLLVQLLAPTTLALIVFFVLPLVWLFRASFDRGLDSGVIESAFTLENYQEFLSDRFYQQELLRTLRLGVVITALTLLAT